MRDSSSEIFASTATVLTTLFGRVLAGTSIGPGFLGCKVTALNSLKNRDTRTDAVCSYRNGTAGPVFDRVKLYHEVVNGTGGFTEMRPYQLDPNSLYVNGYNEALLPSREGSFPVNFTITNLRYRPEMRNPESRVFNLSRNTVASMLDHIAEKSSVGPLLMGCRVSNLRSVDERRKTGVDAVCRYREDPVSPAFNRVRVYHEFINATDGFGAIGPYALDRKSLLVDGYHEPPIEEAGVVPLSHQPAGTDRFTTNFSVTNLRYRPSMSDPRSAIFDSTQQVFATLMDRLFKSSSIGDAFTRCNVTALRSLPGGTGTGVDSVCTYKREAAMPSFDRMKVYHEVMNQTQGFMRLGPYAVAKNSLYVNGYNEPSIRLGQSPSRFAPDGVGYELGFTIINENLTSTDPSSPGYKELEVAVKERLNRLFQRSAVSNGFKICIVTGLRVGSVIVDCKCYFDPDIDVSRQTVEETFRRETQNGSSQWLGRRFQFEGMRVRAIDPAVAAVTDTLPAELHLRNFALNFTVTNLPFRAPMGNPASEVSQSTKTRIQGELENLYERSGLRTAFLGCSVENLRATGLEDRTGVDATCAFEEGSGLRRLDRKIVYDVFKNLTGNGSALGRYALDHRSLAVDGYPSPATPASSKTGLPFWAIILICLAVLLGFVLLFVICCMTNFCRKTRAGKYDFPQNIWNTYFPHLEMRRRTAM